ncbi:hypothetical protein CAEBREN_18368 [Caenorhabditis brenneri]|uniref:Sdz-33 F-box domain-containing protein n=1 Tax=Caenorhabditis brenneri TaxID=135651 RepID=G0NWW6_CAEBE|nr:hypothetical protein CAEBREN_18368 [Caenorhabditis brenneri]
MSKKPTAVQLDFVLGPFVRLRFPNGGWEEWGFKPDEKHAQKDCYSGQRGCFQEYRFHCDHLVPTILKLLDNILYVFNSELHAAILAESRLKNDEFDSVLNWIKFNSTRETMRSIQFYLDSEMMFYHALEFLKSFKKQIPHLTCSVSSQKDSEISKRFRRESEICNIDDLCISTNLMTNSMDVNTLTRINYRSVEICRSTWTNRDVNFFLKSWASGNSNSRMEYADLNINEVIDLDVILNGLSPEFRDPRTTKRKFVRDGKTYSVFGGIDIQRNDGKVATIQWIRHAMKDDIDSIPQEWIDEFESKRLVNTPPLFEEKEVLEVLREKRKFLLPKWYDMSLYIIVW